MPLVRNSDRPFVDVDVVGDADFGWDSDDDVVDDGKVLVYVVTARPSTPNFRPKSGGEYKEVLS